MKLDGLANVNTVCWYGHALRREDGHIMRMALHSEVEGQS